MEADTDAKALQAPLDAVADAVTADEVNASLDALDDHLSRLTESSARTLLKRALNALRAVDAPKASSGLSGREG
jgi:hypothetical protein